MKKRRAKKNVRGHENENENENENKNKNKNKKWRLLHMFVNETHKKFPLAD